MTNPTAETATTDDQVFCALADRAEVTLEQHPDVDSWTPSALARKARMSTDDAHRALRYLAGKGYILAGGNGARTRYSLTDSNRDNARRNRHAFAPKGVPATMSASEGQSLAVGDDFELASVDPDYPDEERDSHLSVLGGGPSPWGGTFDYVTFSIYGDNNMQIPYDRLRDFIAKLAAVSGIKVEFPA